MNITTRLRTLFLGLFILAAGFMHAQKFGHLNYGNLLLDLPQVVSANTQLEAFQKPLIDQVEARYKTFQASYQKALAEGQKGTMSPLEQKQKEEELMKEQQAIAKLEQDTQAKMMKKREELLKPILKQIENAVTAVGKEGGYSGIFDTSNGQLLYAVDSEDVMDKVKAKL